MKKPLSYLYNLAFTVVLYLVLLYLILSGKLNSYTQGILISIGINIILAVSLNLTVGFLGELALGHAGFMAVGAYASAILSKQFIDSPALFPVSLIFGGLVAAFIGFLIGIPALRLRGDYLAIITLGFGEIIRVIIQNVGITGGAKGLLGIPNFINFHYVYIITALVIACSFMLIRSRHGRAIMAIREDIIAAEASGIPTTYYKILAFVISAFFAGIAGGLYAHFVRVLGAENFGFMKSIEILIIVVLGGMGSITGSVVAAITLTLLPEFLRSFSEWRMLIYSLILVLMMIFKPSGLLGRSEFSLLRFPRDIKGLYGRLNLKGGKK